MTTNEEMARQSQQWQEHHLSPATITKCTDPTHDHDYYPGKPSERTIVWQEAWTIARGLLVRVVVPATAAIIAFKRWRKHVRMGRS